MSGASEEVKTDKREREEPEASPAAVVSDTPAAKKLKADGEAATAEVAPKVEVVAAAEDVGAVAAAAAPAAAPAASAASVPALGPPSAMDEEKKAAPISDENMKEVEASVLKMLEFYFGGSNFGWDRFMQSKAGKMGENLMDASILMSFNKLKNIVRDGGLDTEEGLALIARMGEASPALRVSEDKTQIGRAVAMTEADGEERLGRTVQTRGYNKDSRIQIEDVEKLFAETGEAKYVKICKAGGGKKLTSIFVEFDTKENAEKAVEQSEKYSFEGEAVSVRLATNDPDRAGGANKEANNAAVDLGPEPVVYEPGKIIHITDISESGVSRESLKDAVQTYGTVKYVDFSYGGREAWLRMENPSEAAAAVAGAKDDGLQLAAEVEQKGAVALLEGDLEKTYYERLEKMRAERNSRPTRGRGRGRGRGKGRGRGRGGGGGGRGRGRGGD